MLGMQGCGLSTQQDAELCGARRKQTEASIGESPATREVTSDTADECKLRIFSDLMFFSLFYFIFCS